MMPYITAYNGINAMPGVAAQILSWLIPVDRLLGLVPWGALAARLGLSAALRIVARLMASTLTKLAAQVGGANLLTMTAEEANQLMAGLLFDHPPFLPGVNVTEITTTEAMASGQAAGSQLIRFAPDLQGAADGGGWLTTLDQVTNADGTMMSAIEIQDKLALPTLPAYYAPVSNVPTGSDILVGIANSQPGWGTGGGVQYFVRQGNIGFGTPVSLSH